MAESFVLEAESRSLVGKKVSQLRNKGLVPVVVYGPRAEPVHLQIPYRSLQLTLLKAGGTHLINLQVGDKTHTVLAREVQRDVLRGDILHVDFFAVDASTKIRTEVPVHFVGESPAEASRLATLVHGVNSLTIETLPADLMSQIEVNLSGLKQIGDAIHVSDLNLGEKITIVNDPEEMIIRVIPIQTSTDEEMTDAASPAEVEVIAKGKVEEEDF